MLDDLAPEAFDPLVERRMASEPVAYITGRRAFWTIELSVGPGVLIPRPDSETLIEAAVEHFGEPGPATILDLGTGPGTLLLAALAQWPDAQGLGIDSSGRALDFAERNAMELGSREARPVQARRLGRGASTASSTSSCATRLMSRPVRTCRATSPTGSRRKRSTPPPTAFPNIAAWRVEIPRLLAPGGLACLELGAGQRDAVAALFDPASFTIKSRKDLKGFDRCLLLSR